VVHKFWRGSATTTIATGIWSLVMVCTLCLGYGLDYVLGALDLERSMIPWLAIGSRVFFWNYSICQG